MAVGQVLMKFTSFFFPVVLVTCSVATLLNFPQASLVAQTQNCQVLPQSIANGENCSTAVASNEIPSSLSATLYPDSQNDNVLNRKVYEYAIANMGEQIGNGECSFLIHNALVAAGAKTFNQLGPTDLYSDYVWGKLVTTITPHQIEHQSLKVGDIIQFRDASTYEKITKPDGSWKTRRVKYTHHTSIIAEVKGTRLVLIHQNFGNDPATKKTVQKSPLDLATLQSGILWVYRPIQ